LKELRTIRLLFPLLRRYPWGLPAMIALGTLSSVAEGIGISLFVPLMQSLGPQDGTAGSVPGWVQTALDSVLRRLHGGNRMAVIAGTILAMTICKALLGYADSVLAASIGSRITHSIRSRIFSKVMNMPQEELDRAEPGRLINLLGMDTWRAGDAIGLLVTLMVSLCSILVFSALLVLISWKLTILALIGILSISVLLQMVSLGARTLGRQGVETNAALSEQMLDGLNGIQVIQMFALRGLRERMFNTVSEKVRSIYFRLDLLHRAGSPLSEVMYVCLLLGILLVGIESRASLPAVMVFLLLLYRLQPQIRQFDSARLSLVALTSSVEDTTRFLESAGESSGPVLPAPPQSRAPELRFERVRFFYDSEAAFSLDGVSFRAPAGKTTAIVGPSGSGKTTLVSLLCHFREPFSGEILADGQPLASMNLDEWRTRISWAGQDSYLFAATVRENIRYGNLAASDDQVIDAAIQADADDFIRQLPDGYDTRIGSSGVALSGGQTQRLALARAFLRKPPILILDEATSALDSISEDSIQRYLRQTRREQTVIVISHRLSTVKYADHIVVLNQGRVTEQGSPQEMFARRGFFSKLRELQNVQ
jgi:subfamily B ATP-binding cassette protein MsbA